MNETSSANVVVPVGRDLESANDYIIAKCTPQGVFKSGRADIVLSVRRDDDLI